MNSEELLKILQKAGVTDEIEIDEDDYSDIYCDGLWGKWLTEEDDTAKESIEKATGLKLELIEQRNDPDNYEIWEIIFSVNDYLFRLDGYYSSYDSPDIDYLDFKAVRPVTKTYTAYIEL